jgi:hypothetical protein
MLTVLPLTDVTCAYSEGLLLPILIRSLLVVFRRSEMLLPETLLVRVREVAPEAASADSVATVCEVQLATEMMSGEPVVSVILGVLVKLLTQEIQVERLVVGTP